MLWRTNNRLFRCLLCQQHFSSQRRTICSDCWFTLPWLENSCSRCALPALKNETYCKICSQHNSNPFQTQSIFSFSYVFPINQLLKLWKFQGHIRYTHLFTEALLSRIEQQTNYRLPKAIMPVPISRQRYQKRGFNQAYILSKKLARQLNIAHLHNMIGAVAQSKQQASLNASERAIHRQHSFFIQRHISIPKHIALVDDIMTTGHTLHHLASLLYDCGARQIDYWGVARVIKTKHYSA